jgi:CheY-like chemotaxis protein
MRLYKSVLLVDDDLEDQEIFIDALKEVDQAIQIVCSSNSEEVIKVLEQNTPSRPDLLFLDLNMPRLNGKQLLAELKKTNRFSDIPVVMYSTHFEEKDIEEINRLGAAHHLIKPSKFSELCNSLDYILKKRW